MYEKSTALLAQAVRVTPRHLVTVAARFIQQNKKAQGER